MGRSSTSHCVSLSTTRTGHLNSRSAMHTVQVCCRSSSTEQLLCHKCMGVHFKAHASNSPCCETSHSPSSFIPAPEVLVKIISALVLRCSTCNSSIELRRIREHTASGCVHTTPPSPSRLTLGQIMSQPADAPLMAVEKKLATSMVKRILNTSPQQSSSTDIISLPTAGQVYKIHVNSIHIKTHKYNCELRLYNSSH